MAAAVPIPARPAHPGRSRLVLVLLAVAVALLGALVAPGSAEAAARPAPCHANHHTKNGHAEHDCGFYLKTTVYTGVHTRQQKTGTIHGGTNWVVCQSVGKTVHYGRSYNHWWAYTLSDQGSWGWVNAVFAKGGGNNGKFKGVPACSSTTRYDGSSYADYPPQSYTAYGARLGCEVYDDPGADVYAATCQRYHLSNGKGATKATGEGDTVVCDLESRKYEGRRICEISGLY